jgi:exodeoxyribonuclease V gamma subunit
VGLLAAVLADAPADPLAPEWIAVPSVGMRRWLSLELARHLGAAEPHGGDGVAANLTYAFPGQLRTQVLAAGRAETGDPDDDPWTVSRLVWPVLAVLAGSVDHPVLGTVATVGPGGSRYARARRIADLFDRYHVHRPAMVRAWAAGDDVDPVGRRLADHHRWQPNLWRAARAVIGQPSPPEVLPDLLARTEAGTLSIDLPDRLSLFGLSVLPGGRGFVDLAAAVARQRDVHLFLYDPSPAITDRLRNLASTTGRTGPRLRADDDTARLVPHPLLRSWGRVPRETATLLGDAETSGAFPSLQRPPPATDAAPTTLLAQVQADLLAGAAPAADHVLGAGDRSLQLHAAHGPVRQVEVLRDAILHLLAVDPTLREDQIVVLCPAIDRFAPLIEIGFGPSGGHHGAGDDGWDAVAADHPPALRYRVADRSLRAANPVVAGLLAITDAALGRFTAPGMLDLAALPAVRRRFELTDDDLSRLADWVDATNVRWGLDGGTRAAFGVPATVTANTWGAAVDRLLLGAAIDGDHAFALGGVVPHGIEGDDVDLAGRLAELVGQVRNLAEAAGQDRPLAAWTALLDRTSHALLAPSPDEPWHAEALTRALEEAVDDAGAAASTTFLSFADVRRLLADRLGDAPGRPDLLRGGITITSPDSLRRVPHRVVCLLGMDQAAFASRATDGDDLAAANPLVGDRDRRAESRLAVLDAVLSAEEHLIVVRDGHDLRTNQPIPPSVVVDELLDTVIATRAVDPTAAAGKPTVGNERHHPRQPFDDRCFVPGALGPVGPWSFDPTARRGAQARRTRGDRAPVFLRSPLAPETPSIIELADLQALLDHPVKTFLQRRLQVRIPREEDALPTRLPVDLNGLQQWKVGDRLLRALLDHGDLGTQPAIEEAIGSIPPGVLGDERLHELLGHVEGLAHTAEKLGLRRGEPTLVPIDLTLPSGARVVGTVAGRLAGTDPDRVTDGPLRIGYSRMKPKYVLGAWLDLLALVATDPDTPWRSAAVYRHGTSKSARKPTETTELISAGAVPEHGRALAMEGLELVVDLLRRARCEPLPLFGQLSPKLHAGHPEPKDWIGFGFGGDGADAWNRVAFGGIDYHGLLDLAAQPDDPPGSGLRAERYAHHLWSAVERTSTDLAVSQARR